MEQINESMLEQLKENFRKIVLPKRTINLMNVLNDLIKKEKLECDGEIQLEEIIKEVFPSEINKNESTSQQFSVKSQFKSDDNMEIENDFHNDDVVESEINLTPEDNCNYDNLLNDIFDLLKGENSETRKKLLIEVKKDLEPELTELSQMN